MARPALKQVNDDSRYRLLLEAITDYAIYMLDAQGYVSSWNPGAERFKGYTAPEILGQHFSRFYTEEDRADGLPERALRTAERQGHFENEGWRIRKDGGRFWAHVVIDPIRSPSGQLLGFAKITRDLTERRAAEETLRQSQEQFRLLVQGVTDYAIFMLDPSGQVASWNAGAQRIKGYEPDEIIGQHFSRFYTEEDRADGLPKRALETAVLEGRFEHEGWRVRKDGSRFWASVVIDAIRDDDGRLIGFAKVTRDITERREAQQALEQAQEELLQSRKMEALGQLAGGVAHDFNNLLMAISGSLELLQKRVPNDPKITRLLNNALQGAHRGAALTTRMLAFSRRQPTQPQLVDLPTLVRGMNDLLRLSLSSIAIETQASLSVSPVMVDPNQLELALLNVAANARDAMPQGGTISIAITEEYVSPSQASGLKVGSYVRLSVTDTGEGMDEETLSRATEPFFTTKAPGKGTGLGLPMVHGLLQEAGGRLVLKSRKGEGSTVEMWLPAVQRHRSPEAGTTAARAEATSSERPLTVLAVDDDELVLMNTVAMLEDLGHRVLEAQSGPEALKLLEEEQVDLVITDQIMPRMTGTELAAAARATRPDLPVILASGFLDLPRVAASPRLAKLDKPFSLEQLRSIIRDTVK